VENRGKCKEDAVPYAIFSILKEFGSHTPFFFFFALTSSKWGHSYNPTVR
jgi:hypothetical protein